MGVSINLTLWIPVIIGLITVVGFIVRFFQKQTQQDAEIDALEKEVRCIKDNELPDLKRKVSDQAHYQIQTEKTIVEINTKLDNIIEAINELKSNRGK